VRLTLPLRALAFLICRRAPAQTGPSLSIDPMPVPQASSAGRAKLVRPVRAWNRARQRQAKQCTDKDAARLELRYVVPGRNGLMVEPRTPRGGDPVLDCLAVATQPYPSIRDMLDLKEAARPHWTA